MNSPEVDRLFNALVGDLDLRTDGVREYHDVTASLATLQDDLAEHLVTARRIDPQHTLDETARRHYLDVALEKDFNRLTDIQYGDTITTKGNGLLYLLDDSGDACINRISDQARLHGQVHGILTAMVPAYDSVVLPDGELDVSRATLYLSAALYIKDPTIEEFNPDNPYAVPVPIDAAHVLLPLSYAGLKVLRRVDGE